MTRVWNGQYETEDFDLSKAHNETLELLGIIHNLSLEMGLKYTLIDNALLLQVNNKPFGNGSPFIQIAMSYESFLKLKARIKEFVKDNLSYAYADKDCMDQFDSLSFWFLKRNRVTLPEERKQDEIYYYNRVIVVPAFMIRDNKLALYAEEQKIKKTYNVIRARTTVSELPIFTRIKFCYGIWKNKKYMRLKSDNTIDNLEKRLIELNGNYRYGCFENISENINIIEKNELGEVETISLSGQPCYISKYADRIASRYDKEYVDSVVKYRTSDLIRNGGEMLRRVQLIQIDMLLELDRICRKNGLRYNLAFGTFLGSVRHKGFIPWDDDIDVFMPIEDYHKLDEVMKTDLDTSKYYWRTFESEPVNTITFKQMRRNGTMFIQPGREKYQKHLGICIDVIPLFHQANTRIGHWFHTKHSRFYRTATWAFKGAEREKNPILKAYYMQIRKPDNKTNYNRFLRVAMGKGRKNEYYSCFMTKVRSPFRQYFMSEDAFNNPIEMEFEGHSFLGPSKIDESLTYIYGKDYMQYPGLLSNRTPDHLAIIDVGDLYSYDNEENNN